jgi:hypothetical protein
MKNNYIKFLEFLFIGVLSLGFLTILLNNHEFNYLMVLVLNFLCKSILFGSLVLFLILIVKLTIKYVKNCQKDFLVNIKKEVKILFPLKIGIKAFFFSVICFLFSFVLIYFDIFNLAVLLFFSGIFFLFKDTTLVKCWLIDINKRDLIINEKFREKYSNIYLVTIFFRFFFVFYFFYFCIFCLDFEFLLSKDSIETTFDHSIKLFESLYIMFLVFLNSVVINLFLEFLIMFYDADLVLTYGNLLRRASKTAAIAAGPVVIAGSVISVTPLVELPGVNEFQIHFGRGYGYRTSLDWAKGTIINSYIDKSIMKDLAYKYATDDKILDGNSFRQIMQNEPEIQNYLNQNATPYEQRILGLRTF